MESDIDAEIRRPDGVRNSPTLDTPEVDDPGGTKAEDSAAVVARRTYVTAQSTLVKKDKGVSKLGKLIVLLRTEFSTAGLDLASFDFNDHTKMTVAEIATAAAIPTGEDSEAKQLLKIAIDTFRVLERHYGTSRTRRVGRRR
ncbi:hypothetical protein CYMTET_25503 [Cymbomonas tetramitiformis]|uniref:Uncharacterized protein n=1 Tax=Cymbomonas tetramitiformis TaxID=36881 RepID=A0AAE0FUC0_9CHLO|nr:hypothetical protein CYMTET_25503 [Cymbomonas tetramitiformis]